MVPPRSWLRATLLVIARLAPSTLARASARARVGADRTQLRVDGTAEARNGEGGVYLGRQRVLGSTLRVRASTG